MSSMPQNKGTSDGDGSNGWIEYRRLVLAEIERLSSAVSKNESQNNVIYLDLTQKVSDSRNHLLDKLRELATNIDVTQEKQISDLARELRKVIKDVDDEQKRQGRSISALRAQAALFGAAAGFLVAVAGVIASIIWRH